MYRTDDPIADSVAYDNYQQAQLEKLPVCSECGEPIQDEFAYFIGDEWICEDCMQSHRKAVE